MVFRNISGGWVYPSQPDGGMGPFWKPKSCFRDGRETMAEQPGELYLPNFWGRSQFLAFMISAYLL